VHFITRWGNIVQVVFNSEREALHEAMMSFIAYRKLNPKAFILQYSVLRPLVGDMLRLDLTVHPDFYFGEIVRRKQWEFLLSPSFLLTSLAQRGIALPFDKLASTAKRLRDDSDCASAPKKSKNEATQTQVAPPPLHTCIEVQLK